MNKNINTKTHNDTMCQLVHKKVRTKCIYYTTDNTYLYFQWGAIAVMVWYLTPDQVLIHHRDSRKTNEKQDNDNNNNSRENPNYDFSIDKVQSIENKGNSSKHNQIVCSVCKRSDKIVTDPESGEIICSNCGMVLSDKVEDTKSLRTTCI